MQSNLIASKYLEEIRKWVDSNPNEIVVLWLSKHGSPCATGEEQYPNTTVQEKQAYWEQILTIFSGLLPDFR